MMTVRNPPGDDGALPRRLRAWANTREQWANQLGFGLARAQMLDEVALLRRAADTIERLWQDRG